MYFLSVSLLLVFAIGSAVAQSSSTVSAAVPTSTAGIDPCILGCVQSAASSNGCSSLYVLLSSPPPHELHQTFVTPSTART